MYAIRSYYAVQFPQMRGDAVTDLVGLFRGPFPEPLTGLHAKFALRHEFLEIRRGALPVLEICEHRFVDVERQVGADQVGILRNNFV